MTRVSAENLKLNKDIAQFSDIIHFDIGRHTLYFSDLLRGDPPMAPVNPGYAKDVHRLKELGRRSGERGREGARAEGKNSEFLAWATRVQPDLLYKSLHQ